SSSAAVALRPLAVSILYAIGILSTVFHFSNGLWTLGITWGLWTSPAAMRRANAVSVVVGLVLGAAGLGALGGMRGMDVEKAKAIETIMNEEREARERMLRGERPEPQSGGAVRPAVSGAATLKTER
ncbi:MAG: hypothetical protein ACKO6B_08230, partial [Planctomycetia bacterium]